jgi:citrate lyase beta subunit
MPDPRPLTAVLFVPGDRPDRFGKAVAAGADLVVLDLEDAVAPARKAAAREAVRAALRDGFAGCVRINPVGTADGKADTAMLRDAGPAFVMIPKTAAAAEVASVHAALPGAALIALIESIAGISSIEAIAQAPGGVALAFGGYDLCAELGARPTSEVLAPWRARVVFAARRAGIGALDTPYAALDDAAGLAQDAMRAVDFGFDGKLVIHPRQIPVVRSAFVPAAEEIARARAVVAAAGAGGVMAVGNTMIDAPLVAAARRVLSRVAEDRVR